MPIQKVIPLRPAYKRMYECEKHTANDLRRELVQREREVARRECVPDWVVWVCRLFK